MVVTSLAISTQPEYLPLIALRATAQVMLKVPHAQLAKSVMSDIFVNLAHALHRLKKMAPV